MLIESKFVEKFQATTRLSNAVSRVGMGNQAPSERQR